MIEVLSPPIPARADAPANIDLTCDERPSDSPFVERVWHSRSDTGGSFVSVANARSSMVVSRIQGKTFLTVRGPEIRPTPAFAPDDAEFFGIMFKPGTLMPDFPARVLMDRNDVNLPEASSRKFWLNGTAWEFPDFDNVDTFVHRLVREGLLIQDSTVANVLQGKVNDLSLRSEQRRFLLATGLTHGTLRQIERARCAAILLKRGMSILDTVDEAGYADQPHLTRSLKHWLGVTPAQILSNAPRDPLSFLFKTSPF